MKHVARHDAIRTTSRDRPTARVWGDVYKEALTPNIRDKPSRPEVSKVEGRSWRCSWQRIKWRRFRWCYTFDFVNYRLISLMSVRGTIRYILEDSAWFTESTWNYILILRFVQWRILYMARFPWKLNWLTTYDTNNSFCTNYHFIMEPPPSFNISI